MHRGTVEKLAEAHSTGKANNFEPLTVVAFVGHRHIPNILEIWDKPEHVYSSSSIWNLHRIVFFLINKIINFVVCFLWWGCEENHFRICDFPVSRTHSWICQISVRNARVVTNLMMMYFKHQQVELHGNGMGNNHIFMPNLVLKR